jgi:hypothetical protein
MKRQISLVSVLILIVLSSTIATAAPAPSSVIVANTPAQSIPITAPAPLNVSIFRQPFVLFDSGFVSVNLNTEVNASNCNTLLACVINNSIGAINLPVTLTLGLVYPPLVPPACSGSGQAFVPLQTLTVDSGAAQCASFPNSVIPACLRVSTDGQAPSFSVLLLCQ